jgi:hypothetical protein
MPGTGSKAVIAYLPSLSPSEPRRGSNWVAVGKGTVFVPAAHGLPAINSSDPAGVELFGPCGAEGDFWWTVTVGSTHGYSRGSPSGSTEPNVLE